MSARPPVLYSQLAVNDPQRANDCGECVDAELLSVGGFPSTPAQVIAALGSDGVTDPQQLVGLLTQHGATVTDSVTWQQLAAGVANGGWGLLLMHDDSNANPSASGPLLHWVLPYNINADGSVQTVNSWPDASGNARDIAYSAASLAAAFVWGAVVSWPVHGVSDMPANIKQYTASDGQHLAFVDGNGNLFDGRLTASGWDYGDGPGKAPNPTHAIQPGVRPLSGVEAAVIGNVPNIWVTGSLGDLVHMAFVNAHWSRQPS